MVRQARNNEDSFVELDELTVHFETDKAFLVSLDGNKDRSVWIPKSQLKDIEVKLGKLTCMMPEWLAENKELV